MMLTACLLLCSACRSGETGTDESTASSPQSAPTAAVDELTRTTERLISRLRQDPDDDDAIGALSALADAAVPALRGALGDPDADVRIAILQALRAIPGDDSFEGLLTAFQDEDENVRYAAAEGLGERANPRAVPVLRERYDADDDNQVRYEILTALGMIGDPSTVPFLAEQSSSDDPYTRLWAIDALCQMRAAEAVGIATRLLGDPEQNVRRRVMSACGDMLVRDDAVAGLIHLAVHGSDFSETVNARRQLQKLLAASPGGQLRERVRLVAVPALEGEDALKAALVLADINDLAGLDVLRNRYADSDPFARHHIAFELGRLGGTKSVPPLIALLEDPVELVAATAHDALLNFAERGDEDAKQALANYKGKTFPTRLKDLSTAQ